MRREATKEDYAIEQVATARAIAHVAHHGQTDKAGEPYISHPERVAQAVNDATDGRWWVQIAAAWLHDVLEDSPLTAEDLTAFGVDTKVIYVVKILTRSREVHTADYYRDIRVDFDARTVKRADIDDNLNPRRLAKLDDATVARLVKKYAKALDALDGRTSQ